MTWWQIAVRFLHSWSPFLFSSVSQKSLPWCTSSPMSGLVYGNRQWKDLSCKKIYLRNIWRESVMRQVSLKLSSLSFGISRCCCRKGWLPLPVQAACCPCVLSLCIWLGFGWVSFHLGPGPCSNLPTSAQTLLLGRDSGENRQVGVERKVEPSALPDSSGELRQAGGLQNHHLHRDSRRVGGWVQGGVVKISNQQ